MKAEIAKATAQREQEKQAKDRAWLEKCIAVEDTLKKWLDAECNYNKLFYISTESGVRSDAIKDILSLAKRDSDSAITDFFAYNSHEVIRDAQEYLRYRISKIYGNLPSYKSIGRDTEFKHTREYAIFVRPYEVIYEVINKRLSEYYKREKTIHESARTTTTVTSPSSTVSGIFVLPEPLPMQAHIYHHNSDISGHSDSSSSVSSSD